MNNALVPAATAPGGGKKGDTDRGWGYLRRFYCIPVLFMKPSTRRSGKHSSSIRAVAHFYKRSTTQPPTYGKQAKSSPYNEWLTIITEIIGTQTPPLTTGSGMRSILQAKHARTTKCRQWDAQHLASEPLSIRRISGCKLPPPPALELAPRPSR